MKRKKKSRKKLTKVLLLLLLFLVILGATLFIAINRKSSSDENYEKMQAATLPLITLSYVNEKYETELHGYVNEMDNVGMRDIIVPVGEDRSLSFGVIHCENKVESVKYHLRSLDDTEYLDDGEVTKFREKTDRLLSTLTFSSFMESGNEYRLILEVLLGDGRTVYYYARILYAETNYTKELLAFAEEFSDATYDREKAETFLVNYIQPEDNAPVNDFSYTDIHSKYSMLTYAGLNVKRNGEPSLSIAELSPTQLSATFSYDMEIELQDAWQSFAVTEYFCVRYRSGKVYLLDYYRTLNQYFDAEHATEEKGRILLGVSDGSTQILNSENNNYTVFVEDRELWSYSTKTNAMSLIFSFNDEEDLTSRSSYDHHNVQVVKVSDDGSIDYMVYGYMNRGTYEGQVGICFYRYMSETNAAKRLFFMPVKQSEQLLSTDLGTLAYVNEEDVCYLRYGDGIYSIDLKSGESVSVSLRACPGMYAMNEKGNVVAWQEGEDMTYPERLVILNMDSQTTSVVDAPEGQYVKILDFIGDDIVYGFGDEKNSIIEANIDTEQLLSSIVIAGTDEKLLIRENYEAENCYILSARVEEKRVLIELAEKTESGTLKRLEDDVLLLTQELYSDTEKSMLLSRESRTQKKEYYIQIGNAANNDSQFSTVVPRFETLKTANVIELQRVQSGAYYVYGYGKLMYVESEISKAIDEAYEGFGVVVDDEMNYLWTRGTRDLVHTISIQPYTASSKEETLGAALQVLAAKEGMQLRNVEADLDSGLDPLEIIDSVLGEGSAVSLYGCTLQEVLYFINENRPVLAVTGDREAVVICGYDTTGVQIYFPETGATETILTEIAEDYFEGFDNSFISYK